MMPIDRDAARPGELGTPYTRRSVLGFAVVLTGAMILTALEFGHPLPMALMAGLGTGVSGLAAWWTQHLISRRTDGIGFFFIVTGVHFNVPERPIGPVAIGGGLVFGVLVGGLAGGWARWFPRRRARGKK